MIYTEPDMEDLAERMERVESGRQKKLNTQLDLYFPRYTLYYFENPL